MLSSMKLQLVIEDLFKEANLLKRSLNGELYSSLKEKLNIKNLLTERLLVFNYSMTLEKGEQNNGFI